MRTEVVNYTVYKFDELSENIQKRVIEKLRDINIWDDWHECVIEDIKDSLITIGFEDPDTQYSGFWSQGDGASFTSSCNIKKLVEAIGDKRFKRLVKLSDNDYFSLAVVRDNHRYSHKYTCRVDSEIHFNWERCRKLDALVTLFESYVEDLRKKWCDTLYERLEQEYDFLTSDEVIVDSIQANGYEFLENGEIFEKE